MPFLTHRRPVAAVVREYASFRGRVVVLWDDNVAGDVAYAKELFRALAPHPAATLEGDLGWRRERDSNPR